MENQPPSAPPPPPTPPPVPPLINPMPPLASSRKKSPGSLWKVLLGVAVLGLLLVIGAVLLLGHFAGSLTHTAHMDGRWLEEVVIENNHSRNKIAVVDLNGIITDSLDQWTGVGLVRFIKDQLHTIGEDDSVKAVILKVDSPGGEVLASDDIYKLIADFQKRTDKPVIASMGSLAASGGYYVSAPCRWIVANELTITGSIGVIMHGYNYRGLMNKVGVRPEVFKSGKFKDMLSGDKEPEEITAEERAMVQSLIDETYQKFSGIVAAGRGAAAKSNQGEGRELSKNWKDHADGRIFSGKQAYDLGFVDELGDFDTALARAQKIVGISTANVVQYRAPATFANIFRILGKTEAPKIKIDLGADLPRIQAGRLYFISSHLLH